MLPLQARVDLGVMALKGYFTFPKIQHYWNLTIRLFSVISRTLIEDMGRGAYTSAVKYSVYSTAPPNWTKRERERVRERERDVVKESDRKKEKETKRVLLISIKINRQFALVAWIFYSIRAKFYYLSLLLYKLVFSIALINSEYFIRRT